MRYVILLLVLAACATPKYVLENKKTGQVVVCGGTATGSLVGGLIGHQIQKNNDNDCVADHVRNGFLIKEYPQEK